MLHCFAGCGFVLVHLARTPDKVHSRAVRKCEESEGGTLSGRRWDRLWPSTLLRVSVSLVVRTLIRSWNRFTCERPIANSSPLSHAERAELDSMWRTSKRTRAPPWPMFFRSSAHPDPLALWWVAKSAQRWAASSWEVMCNVTWRRRDVSRRPHPTLLAARVKPWSPKTLWSFEKPKGHLASWLCCHRVHLPNFANSAR